MTGYSDILRANQLYLEQQTVQQGIDLIDAGGSLMSFTIGPPPPPPYNPGDPAAPMFMSVAITSLGTVSPDEVMASIRTQLVERESEIIAELVALGIVDMPVRGPPPRTAEKQRSRAASK